VRVEKRRIEHTVLEAWLVAFWLKRHAQLVQVFTFAVIT